MTITAPPEATAALPAPDRPDPAERAGWRAHWAARSRRERIGLTIAAMAVGASALWMGVMAPALRTLQQAPARLSQLDEDLARMRALAREVATLRSASPPSEAASREAVEAATARLGSAARLQWLGDRAVLQLERAPADRVPAWLSEVRAGARLQAQQVQLRRDGDGLSGSVTVRRSASP